MGKYFAEQNPKLPANVDLYSESSTQQCPLGTTIQLADGRRFVYFKNSANAQAIATLMQGPAPVAAHLNLAVQAAAAIGATTVKVTNATTAITANQYAEGFLHIDAPAGSVGGGQTFKIKSHDADATTSGTVTFELYDAVRVALTTASKATLRYHPCGGVIIHPTSVSSIAVGETIMAMTASYYGWLQVAGPCACLINGTVVIGSGVIPDGAGVAGAVIPLAETSITPEIGRVLSVNADDTYALIHLAIPGF
jgi:hypothetical protein